MRKQCEKFAYKLSKHLEIQANEMQGDNRLYIQKKRPKKRKKKRNEYEYERINDGKYVNDPYAEMLMTFANDVIRKQLKMKFY